MAVLHIAGISPDLIEDLHTMARGRERAPLQFFNRMAGKPSGPGAALGVNSDIASASSELLKVI